MCSNTVSIMLYYRYARLYANLCLRKIFNSMRLLSSAALSKAFISDVRDFKNFTTTPGLNFYFDDISPTYLFLLLNFIIG